MRRPHQERPLLLKTKKTRDALRCFYLYLSDIQEMLLIFAKFQPGRGNDEPEI